jgi:methylenetetrahydrofolate reductase (NADPH)
MKIDAALARGKAYSFEFFPPKSPEGTERLLATVAGLRELAPLFVSVTYGAGGSQRESTVNVAKRIKREFGIEVLVHVTCVGSSRSELRRLFDSLAEDGIENVLALRGDPPVGSTQFERHPDDGLSHASELVELLAKEYSFCVGAACYPETHLEAVSPEADLANAKRKVDAGASFLVSQLFFDNVYYFDFVKRARAIGITVPIFAGIMPITDARQVRRFTDMCGATIPQPLLNELKRRELESEGVPELGVAYATMQCKDLIDGGAPGIHFYTLNRSTATRAIVSALRAGGVLEGTLRPQLSS